MSTDRILPTWFLEEIAILLAMIIQFLTKIFVKMLANTSCIDSIILEWEPMQKA